jgi:tRNA threonylcarbamoyladenosine modification (KEOPS) complex  Pcc1 subunit
MFELKIDVKFDDEKEAKVFFASIKPELKNFDRSTTEISLRKEKMIVKIKASDKSALRASLNTILKPLNLFSELKELK